MQLDRGSLSIYNFSTLSIMSSVTNDQAFNH